jgi:type IV pilus assembly protein PilN
MIRVNLLPQKKRALGRSGTQPSQKWLVALLIGVLLEMAGLFFFHQRKLDELAQQEQKNKELTAKIEEIKKELTVLRAREDAIAKLQTARSGPTAVLLEVAQLLTPGKGPTADPDHLAQLRRDNPNLVFNPGWDARRVWITSYIEQDRTVKIEGEARDGNDVSEFAQRLKLSTYFYDVQLLPGKKGEAKDAKLEIVNFALQLKVRY